MSKAWWECCLCRTGETKEHSHAGECDYCAQYYEDLRVHSFEDCQKVIRKDHEEALERIENQERKWGEKKVAVEGDYDDPVGEMPLEYEGDDYDQSGSW